MLIAAFAVAGLLIGSFLTVVAHRVPRRQSIVAPGSRCPECGYELRARDNVPVLSWLALRGRCRSCGARISPEYPLTELATAGLFAVAAALARPLHLAILVAAFLAVMLVVAIIDARFKIVPNAIVYPALLAFAAAIGLADVLGSPLSLVRGLIGFLAYAGPLLVIALAMPQGMGMGDVKLAALIGLVIGSFSLASVAVAAALGVLVGGVAAVVAIIAFGYRRRQQIPFGPALAAGAAVAAVAGERIADAYLSLLF